MLRLCLSGSRFSAGTEHNKAENNLTHSQTKGFFDESLCGCVSGPTTSSSIFQRRVIRAWALRPELLDPILIDQTWPFSPGEEGGFPHGPLFLPNEREAKLAARFDPERIKKSVAYGSTKIRAVCFLCLPHVPLSKIHSSPLGSLRLGQFTMGPGDLIHYVVKLTPSLSPHFDHQRHHLHIENLLSTSVFSILPIDEDMGSATISSVSL